MHFKPSASISRASTAVLAVKCLVNRQPATGNRLHLSARIAMLAREINALGRRCLVNRQPATGNPLHLSARIAMLAREIEALGPRCLVNRQPATGNLLHRPSGNGYITHPSTIPPMKRAAKTSRKKRIRSARVGFQSSAKKSDAATA
jgi:hypothetical protein